MIIPAAAGPIVAGMDHTKPETAMYRPRISLGAKFAASAELVGKKSISPRHTITAVKANNIKLETIPYMKNPIAKINVESVIIKNAGRRRMVRLIQN